MGLSITDAAALITKGYKVSELQEVNKILEANKEDDKNIIELAKKLGFSDFKTTMQLFDMGAQSHTEDPTDENETDLGTDLGTDEHNEGDNNASDDHQSDQGKGDDVDYKQLYEQEKKLREDIQRKNQSKDVSGEDTNESDFDIALRFAQDVLN